MKITYKEDGYELQVGDRIVVLMGDAPIRVDKVTRLTKTQAVCEKQNQQPIRYPRVYGFWFCAKPYQRSTILYRVIDKVEK